MTKILTLGEIMLRLSTCNNERLSDNNCLLTILAEQRPMLQSL